MENRETPKRKYLDTRYDLVAELERLPQSMEIDFVIAEAKAGEYHDFKNNKYACGKIEASRKLRAVGLIPLAKRLEQGEFDEYPDESDKAEMRKTCPPELLKVLGLE